MSESVTTGKTTRTGRRLRRTVLTAAALASMGAAGAALPASPASARPIDCTLSVTIYRALDGMQGSAGVSCDRPEHYSVYVYLRREDRFSNAPVAEGEAHSRGRAGFVYAAATEPCSDVQTNKTYHATARVMDTTYYYPIEVKTGKSVSYWGHC